MQNLQGTDRHPLGRVKMTLEGVAISPAEKAGVVCEFFSPCQAHEKARLSQPFEWFGLFFFSY